MSRYPRVSGFFSNRTVITTNRPETSGNLKQKKRNSCSKTRRHVTEILKIFCFREEVYTHVTPF